MNNNLLVGQIIKLDIRSMGINGEGIGYYNKLAVFVPGAIEKEEVFVKITEVSEKYAKGEIDSFIRESKRRVEPICKFFNECGACTMQHISYKEQLKIKREILINSLKRYTKLDVNSIDIKLTKESEELNYRNKSQMPFKDTNFGLALGLYAPNSNSFIYVDNCVIQKSLVNAINKSVLSILNRHNCHTPRVDNGELKYLVVRALDLGEAQVTFVLDHFDEKYRTIADEIINEIEEVVSVAYTITNKYDVGVFGDKVEILSGKNYIKDEMLGLDVRLSPKSFYQLNKKQSECMYSEILDNCIKESDIVFDGYSGIGILGLLAARKAKHVYSVDLSQDSIKNARIIERANEISNITFYSDRIENRFPSLLKDGIKPDVIVVDPPRSGLDYKVIKAILESDAERLVYISCNSSTLAKNLNDLLAKYKIEYIRPYDFFTETALVETLCVLVKK